MMQKKCEVTEMGCNGNCESCGGCARELVLTRDELDMLALLGQIPFWPVARKREDTVPVFLELQERSPEAYSVILQCMAQKGLISLDFDKPLRGFDDGAYAGYPIRGSMALTQRGQAVLEMLEHQGVREE